ncbi:MAG: type II secretion system F family protein [Syntrophomonadaceae bacterium]|nr:type II secretion system F family protein [Syntrophomonadaceae bacterium]
METIISILVYLFIVCLIASIHFIKNQGKEHLNARLENLTQKLPEETLSEKKRPQFNFNSLLSAVGKNFTAMSFSNRLAYDLGKADILLRVEEFIGLNILTTLGGGLIGFILFGLGTFAILLTLLGAVIPYLYIQHKKKKRAELLNDQIAESLTGMSNSLRAGYSFQQAMDLVSKEGTGPLATEYRRTLREINLGITTEQALQNLIQRAENDDMELMISAVLIQRQIGGNLAEIFDKIADTIRQRIRLQGEVKTMTAQGRFSGIVLALLPVFLGLILTLMDPSYLKIIFEKQIGWILIGGAVVSETVGFIIIRKITDIKL